MAESKSDSETDSSGIATHLRDWWRRVKTSDPRTVIAVRDLNSLRYEKTIVMAILIQLVIAGMSSFLVLGLVSVYSSDTTMSEIGVAGNASQPFLDQMEDEDELEGLPYSTTDALGNAVAEGSVDAGIVAQYQPNSKVKVVVLVPNEELRTTIVITQIKSLLERVEHEQRDEVSENISYRLLDYPDADTSNPYYTFTYTVLIPVLIFLPIFISGSIMVDSVTEEIERQTMELLRVSPTDVTGIVDAKVAVASLLAPLQALAWLVLLSLNGITIAHPFQILLYTFGIAVMFVTVGTAISVRFQNRQNAQLIYSTVLIAGFTLLSILPQSPANIVARLAAGSATPLTLVHVVAMVVVGVGVYLTVRGRLSVV